MERPLQFGLVPVHEDPETHAAIDVVVQTLGETLGRDCAPARCASPRELAERFEAGEIDVAWSSPTLALTELPSGTPLAASVRQGVAYYHGVLFVRRDAPLAGPTAMAGRSVGWVAPTSASGYLFARVALASLGVDVRGFFGEERFLGSHGAVVDAVVAGETEVGATFAVFADGDASGAMLTSGFTQAGQSDAVRILFCTPPIPSDLIVARREVDLAMGPSLRDAVLALPTRAPEAVTRVTGAECFEACRPRFLDPLKVQLADARTLGLIDG